MSPAVGIEATRGPVRAWSGRGEGEGNGRAHSRPPTRPDTPLCAASGPPLLACLTTWRGRASRPPQRLLAQAQGPGRVHHNVRAPGWGPPSQPLPPRWPWKRAIRLAPVVPGLAGLPLVAPGGPAPPVSGDTAWSRSLAEAGRPQRAGIVKEWSKPGPWWRADAHGSGAREGPGPPHAPPTTARPGS